MTDMAPPNRPEGHDAAHNLESSEGQGAHPRTPSQSDAAARPEATLPGPESVATNERGDLPIGFCHRMGEHQAHSYEYMDATYWCRGVGQKPDAASGLYRIAEEAVEAFDALCNEMVARDGVTFETERLCRFRETHIQRLRVALAIAERRRGATVGA